MLSWSNFYQLHGIVLTLRTHDVMIFGGINGKLPSKSSFWKWISCADGENDEIGIPNSRNRSRLNDFNYTTLMENIRRFNQIINYEVGISSQTAQFFRHEIKLNTSISWSMIIWLTDHHYVPQPFRKLSRRIMTISSQQGVNQIFSLPWDTYSRPTNEQLLHIWEGF